MNAADGPVPPMADEFIKAAAHGERRYASRKFLLAVVVLLAMAVTTALRIPIDPATADIVKWTLGLYFTGNVAADWVAARKP